MHPLGQAVLKGLRLHGVASEIVPDRATVKASWMRRDGRDAAKRGGCGNQKHLASRRTRPSGSGGVGGSLSLSLSLSPGLRLWAGAVAVGADGERGKPGADGLRGDAVVPGAGDPAGLHQVHQGPASGRGVRRASRPAAAAALTRGGAVGLGGPGAGRPNRPHFPAAPSPAPPGPSPRAARGLGSHVAPGALWLRGGSEIVKGRGGEARG